MSRHPPPQPSLSSPSPQWSLFPFPESKANGQYSSHRRTYINHSSGTHPADGVSNITTGVGLAILGGRDFAVQAPAGNSGKSTSTEPPSQSQTPAANPNITFPGAMAYQSTAMTTAGRGNNNYPEDCRLTQDHELDSSQSIQSPSTRRSRANSESSSYETNATSIPALQSRGPLIEDDVLYPLKEDDLDPGSFDLLAPPQSSGPPQYSLETRSEQLFSAEHLRIILGDPSLLLRFTAFLSAHQATSIPILIYYLDSVKALKAISYSNAIADALGTIPGYEFTATAAEHTKSSFLEEKAKQAFDVMVRNDLPAYITHTYLQTVSLSITRRITGTLPPHLREASEGLAEVFCLTDPSRPDNPIVFASEEFHRTTQYGISYVLGRNCRFLQGPKTNQFSAKRIGEKVQAGQEHCEVFLNYRRDGSPFMNLLMTAPLCDSRGKIRYFIGAQVDVSGLVKECYDLESFKRLVLAAEDENNTADSTPRENERKGKMDDFRELSEMLNMQELETVRRCGGRMHREQPEELHDGNGANWNKPRVLIHDASPDRAKTFRLGQPSGKLGGVYENYLLVRPHPSLRILFASPSLRVPGILQSHFMAKIGGSPRVKDELTQALADGRGVTAKIRWVSKHDVEGRNRWIHCTPLLGSNGAIGVWMVVIVDDDRDAINRKFRQAPPVDPRFGRSMRLREDDETSLNSKASLRGFAIANGARGSTMEFSSNSHIHNGSIAGSTCTLGLE